MYHTQTGDPITRSPVDIAFHTSLFMFNCSSVLHLYSMSLEEHIQYRHIISYDISFTRPEGVTTSTTCQCIPGTLKDAGHQAANNVASPTSGAQNEKEDGKTSLPA